MDAPPKPVPSNWFTRLSPWQRGALFAACWLVCGVFLIVPGEAFHPKSPFGWLGLILLALVAWILSEIAFGVGWELLLRGAGRYRPIAKVLLITAIVMLTLWSVAHNVATGQ